MCRLSQLNRCVSKTAKLLKQVENVHSQTDSASISPYYIGLNPRVLRSLEHASQDLANEICAERAYMAVRDDESLTMDPRFLVFEFISGFLLRSRQVELVQAFVDSHRSGRSRVEQMIMGQGKTTVIPWLCL